MRHWVCLLLTLGAVFFGRIDQARAVSEAALSAQRSVSLDGVWELGLGQEPSVWREARVPGNLPFQGIEFDGVVWLCTSFGLPADWGNADLALRLPMTANAYDVYVNDERVGGRGRIGPGGELVEKDFRASVLRVPFSVVKATDSNRLEIRLRTFYGNGGVMAPGMLLGPEEIVREDHERRTLRAAILISLFAFAAFFHLVLFVGRRRELHHLWFSLLSAALASVTAGINTFGYFLSHNADFNAYLVFVPILALPFLVLRFWAEFFGYTRSRWPKLALPPMVIGLALLVCSTAYHPLYPFFERVVMPISILILVAALAISLAWTVAAERAGQRGANVILFGVAVYAVSGSFELAWTFRVVDFYVDSYSGFAILVGSMVVAIASRFAWLHQRAELGERDQLTGCLTRHGFREQLRVMTERHDRSSTELSCILLDLDHFKQVNDVYGHTFGDRVLSSMATATSGALRGSDLVARWGGEEFLILLPDQGRSSAIEIAHRVLDAVRAVRFDDVPDFVGTASFGVAARLRGERFEEWFERADQALYQAKHAGRACVRAA
jgi:diguanylate cyclase (GGDEF)-like protein